jgi:hypothetical protein
MPENRDPVTLRLVVFSIRQSDQLHISIDVESNISVVVVLTKKVEIAFLRGLDCAF